MKMYRENCPRPEVKSPQSRNQGRRGVLMPNIDADTGVWMPARLWGGGREAIKGEKGALLRGCGEQCDAFKLKERQHPLIHLKDGELIQGHDIEQTIPRAHNQGSPRF